MSDKSRKILIPIGALAGALIVTMLLIFSKSDAEQVIRLKTKPVIRYEVAKAGSSQIIVHSQGTVIPRTESNVVSQVSGQIVYASPNFASGGFFEKGDLMLRVDPTDYKLARTRAELQVAQAELRLAQEEEESKLAQEEWSKIGNGEAGDLVLRKPQLKEAVANLASAKAGLDQAKINLGRTEINAPYFSRVRSKQADVGQVVNMGTPVAAIYAIDYAEVRLPLPDAELAYIDIPYQYRNGTKGNGPGVKLSSSFAGKEYTWNARLVRLEGEIDQRSRMVNAVARIENPYDDSSNGEKPPLSVGMFVTAEIEGKVYKNVFELSRQALRGENTVWYISEDDKLYKKEVKVLRLEKDKAIIESGIIEGSRICISSLDVVVDGMDVSIDEAHSK